MTTKNQRSTESVPARGVFRAVVACAALCAALTAGANPGLSPARTPDDPAGLTALFQARMARSSPADVRRASRAFLNGLTAASPVIAENLSQGRIDPDDLASRVDVFLSEHPELTGQAAAAPGADPRGRVAALLAQEPGLPAANRDPKALAGRFLAQLAELSAAASDDLRAGRMPDTELQSRVSVFASDIRAEDARGAEDPAITAAAPVVDAYLKANFGSLSTGIESLCFRGVVEEAGESRTFVLFKKRPGSVRVHILDGDLVVGVLAYDGSVAWRQEPGRPAVRVRGRQADELAAMARFDDPLVGSRERGAVVRLESGGSDGAFRLHILETDRGESVATLDKQTYAETSLRVRRPDGGWDESRFADFHKVGTITVAREIKRWENGSFQSTSKVGAFSFNPGLLDAFFSMPARSAFDFGFMDYMGALAARRPSLAQAGGREDGNSR